MLILKQYGVSLNRLTANDLELVRNWRNQSDIANYMEYRNYITPEAQQIWFTTINNANNYYFVIQFEGKKVGVINAKNFNSALGFGEGGIFIGEQEYIDSFAAVFSSLCLLNFVFHHLPSCKFSRVRILKTNQRAIHYNKLMGYKLLPEQDDVDNQLYELSKDDYFKYGAKLNQAAAILNDKEPNLVIEGKVCNENMGEINDLFNKNS